MVIAARRAATAVMRRVRALTAMSVPRAAIGDRPSRGPRKEFGDRGDARLAGRFSDKKFGDKKPYAARDGGGEKRSYAPRGDRPQGDRPFGPRPSRDGDRPRGDRPFGDKKPYAARDGGGEKRSYAPRGDRPTSTASIVLSEATSP